MECVHTAVKVQASREWRYSTNNASSSEFAVAYREVLVPVRWQQSLNHQLVGRFLAPAS